MPYPMKIYKADAFMVNLMDGNGPKLMDANQVDTIIDNHIGVIIDRLSLPFLGARERIALLDAIRPNLESFAYVWDMQDAFNESKTEE